MNAVWLTGHARCRHVQSNPAGLSPGPPVTNGRVKAATTGGEAGQAIAARGAQSAWAARRRRRGDPAAEIVDSGDSRGRQQPPPEIRRVLRP